MNAGCPIMALTANHYPKQEQKRGHMLSVVHEADEERKSGDPDLDPDKTQYNVFIDGEGYQDLGYGSHGDNWAMGVFQDAEEFERGRGKKLRKDAHLAVTTIVKPANDIRDWQNLSINEQISFLRVAREVMEEHLKEMGLTPGFAVIQVDEGNPHMHCFDHSKSFNLAHSWEGLPNKSWLNRDFPVLINQRMEEKYPDISAKCKCTPLKGYKEATEGMTEEEKEEYKAQKRKENKEKRKHGKSSKEYKAEKAEKAAVKRANAKIRESKALSADISAKKEELKGLQDECAFLTGQKKEAISVTLEAEKQKEQARKILQDYEMKIGPARREAHQAEEARDKALSEASQAKAEARQAREARSQAEEQERQLRESITQLERQKRRLEKEAQDLGMLVNQGAQVQQVSNMTGAIVPNEDGIPTVVRR